MLQGIYLPLSRVIFLFCSFTLYIVLPCLLPAAEWGDLAVVLGFYGWLSVSLAEAVAQAATGCESEAAGRAETASYSLIKIFLPAAALLASAGALAAPLMAELFQDAGLSTLLAIGALVPAGHLIIGVFLGVLNGRQNFLAHGAISAQLAFLRVAGALGAALLGWGAKGALGAVVAASLFTAISCAFYSLRKTAGLQRASAIDLGKRVLPLLAFIGASRLLYYQDVFWLKRLLAPPESKVLAGAYLAVGNLTLAPFLLAISVLWLIIPAVHRHEPASPQLAQKIKDGLRWVLLLAAPAESVLAAASPQAISLLYPTQPAFFQQGTAMMLLALSNLLLSFFYVSAAVLNSAGKTAQMLALLFAMLVLQAAGCLALVPAFASAGAALASLASVAAGSLCCAFLLRRRFGSCLPWKSILRLSLASAAAFACGQCLRWPALAELAVCALVFSALALASGELSLSEIRNLRKRNRRP